jgi:hypothetical protein
MLSVTDTGLQVYVSHRPFAEGFVEERRYATSYNNAMRGWFIGRWK